MDDLLFLDIEASSLAADSWPIEVGLAWLNGNGAASTSWLIRPHRSWSRSAWTEESAAVHGLRLEDLRQAPSAVEVAGEVAGRIAGRVLVSDAPEFDARWLGRLLALAPSARPPDMIDFDALVRWRLPPTARDAAWAALEGPIPHRAGPDALRLAGAWAAGRRWAGTEKNPDDVT